MALQLHRSFVSGCLYGSFCAPSRLSIMICSAATVQGGAELFTHLPTISMYCCGSKHGKLANLNLRKAGEVYKMTRKQLEDLRYMVERDSYFNSSTCNEYKIGAPAIFAAQPYVSLPYVNHYKSFFIPSCMETWRVDLSTSCKEHGSRRFFSVKATASKVGSNTSFFKDFDVFRGKTQSFAVRSSNPDACSQVAVSTQPVKKTSSTNRRSVSVYTQPVKKTVSSTSKKLVSRNSQKDIGGDKQVQIISFNCNREL